MSTLIGANIVRAWQHAKTPQRIEYIVLGPDGSERRRWVEQPAPLFAVLADHLQTVGYTGPGTDVEPRALSAADFLAWVHRDRLHAVVLEVVDDADASLRLDPSLMNAHGVMQVG